MKDTDKTKEQLLEEIALLRQCLQALEASQSSQQKQEFSQQLAAETTQLNESKQQLDLKQTEPSAAEIEHLRTEVALKENEQRLSMALNAAKAGIWEWDIVTNTTFWSAENYKLLGYEPGSCETTYQNWLRAVHPEDRIKIDSFIKTVLEKKTKLNLEYRVLLPDGTVRWLNDIGAIIFDEYSNPKGMRGIQFDITRHKQAEAALRESEQRFRMLSQLAPVGIYMTDAQGNCTYTNERWSELTGLSAKQAAGEGWISALHPDDLQHIIGEWNAAIEERREFCQEYRFLNADGATVWVEGRAIALRDETGEITGFIGTVNNITARKQVEAALRESEAIASSRTKELETFMETVPAAVWIAHDPQCHHMTANRAGYEMTRKPIGSEITATPEDGIYPFDFKVQKDGRDIPPDRLPMQLAGSTGQEIEAEFEFVFTDGNVRSIYGKAVPLRDDAGAIRGVIGAFLDRTERKKIEVALLNSEAKLRRIVDSNIIGVFFGDLSGRITTANDAFLHLLGFTRQELLAGQMRWDTLTPPEHIERTRQAEAELRKTGVCASFEKEFFRKDGSRVWVEIGSAVLDSSEEAVCYVIDLTQYKQAQAALQQSQERLSLALEAAGMGSWEWDVQTGHVSWSSNLERIFGIVPGTFDGRYETVLVMIHPEDRERFSQAINRAVYAQEEYNIEFRFIKPDGTIRWALSKGRAFYDQMGTPVRMTGVDLDITERKHNEAERAELLLREQAARQQAEAASRMKDEFLAIVSHELRSPLNAILGWARLLRTRKFAAEKTEQALASIERNAQMQTQLIEDLLDISRIIRGKVRLNLRPISLTPVIQAALDTVRPTASTKSIQIESQLDLDTGLVAGDPDRLQQVIWNLLSNAVKFTPEGGKVEVRLLVVEGTGNREQGTGDEKKGAEEAEGAEEWGSRGVREEKREIEDKGDSYQSPVNSHQSTVTQYAQIQVIDTGKGINPNFLPYVFERFRQADATTTRNHGGLGLGLAIVRNLVELHGGKVAVTSLGEGQGSTFTVQLPLLPKADPVSNIEELSIGRQTYLETTLHLDGLKILVVDDETDTREFLQTALEQYGATVAIASCCSEALQLLQTLQPDVLLSDIGMPGEDGYALIQQIRALSAEQGGKVPAAALTAYAREDDKLKALAAGFQMHVPKPIEPIQLLTVVAKLARR